MRNCGAGKKALRAQEAPAHVFRRTEELLERLGYSITWLNDGNAAIVLTDYPGRPVVDSFRLVYITPPVGYVNPARTENPIAFYSFNAPQPPASKSTFEGSDIRPSLIDLEREIRALMSMEGLGGELRQVAPLLAVLGGDVARVRECLAQRIHPKWLADLFAFGLTYDEALRLREVPSRTLYNLYAAS